MGRIRATSNIQAIFARIRRGRIIASAISCFALGGFASSSSGCNGTILDGIATSSDGFVDGGAVSGIGAFTAIEFEADVVGKFWPSTTINEFLTTGTLPTLAAGYNPKMIINLEKGLKKTLGTSLMASALASIVAGDTSVGAIPVRVKFTTGHMKWTFTLGDAVSGSGAWNTGILIDENGKGSFLTGKLQDTASILETQTGDIMIAGGKSANLAVNWVGIIPSGTTAISSSEDSGATLYRLKKKDPTPYLFYLYSAPVLDLTDNTYNAGTTIMFSNLASAASTNTILVAHAKSGASISPWSNWSMADLDYLTAYQPGDSSNDPNNPIICDRSYNTITTGDYEAYSCITIKDDKADIVDDGNAATYDDLIGNAGTSIWDPSKLFTPSYPIPSNQTDTIKIEAM